MKQPGYLKYLKLKKLQETYGHGKNKRVLVVDTGYCKLDDKDPVISLECPIPDGKGGIDISTKKHGTGVASVIKAICPKATIYTVRCESKDPKLKSYWHAEALDRARYSNIKFDVINMSFAWDSNDPNLYAMIRWFYLAGSKLVAAAGNKAGRYFYPANYLEVTSVGCMYWKDGKPYSGNALGYTILAPGTGVETRVGTLSYTSMAAPVVSAMFALGMSEYQICKWIGSCKPLGEKKK